MSVGSLEMSVDEKYLQAVMRTLSHDMGSSLRAASGFSKLLIEQYGDSLDEKALNWLALIRSEGEIAQKRLKVFSQYAKLHGVDGLSDTCDLALACQRAQTEVGLKQLLANHPDFSLSVSALSDVKGNAEMWQLYFSLIISNAAKYARAGEPVTCSVFTENKPAFNGDAAQVSLVIEDDGVGLSMDHITKALQPYRTLNAPQEGDDVSSLSMGMGLSLAKRIVDMHEGVFVVCARPDGRSGLRVEARLPL
ncbi:ATP-binding protein [Eionea flava]